MKVNLQKLEITFGHPYSCMYSCVITDEDKVIEEYTLSDKVKNKIKLKDSTLYNIKT